jgi:hypothetical protein
MADMIQLSEAVNEKHQAFEAAMKSGEPLNDPRLLAAIELLASHLRMLEWYQDECERLHTCLPAMMAVSDDNAYFRA